MAEYIDIDKAIVVIDTRGREIETTVRHILDINKGRYDTDDVAPVRHGRWIQHYEPYDTGEEWIEAPYGFECSECGRWEVEQEPFCNCGAKMDKEG